MPALRIGEGIDSIQQPEPFRNEYELQEIIAEYPGILVDRDDLSIVTFCREFMIDGGFADIFLIDNNGLPVIVEVKLAQNSESRSEVIGQLTDHLSAISGLTIDEVNERSGGKLEETFRLIAGIGDETERESRYNLVRSNFASYLRSGQVRGIIVLDHAPDDLIREFSYLNEHSDLDLRLMAVERYRLNKTEYFYHSRFLVSGDTSQEIKMQRLRLRLIVEKFSKMKQSIFSMHTTGRENVRVYREGWPTSVHYEFCDWKDSTSIELQVRYEDYPNVADFLPRLCDYLPTVIRDIQRAELYTDSYGWMRLQLFFGDEIDPFWIAQSMVRMCMTEKDISTLLREGNPDHSKSV